MMIFPRFFQVFGFILAFHLVFHLFRFVLFVAASEIAYYLFAPTWIVRLSVVQILLILSLLTLLCATIPALMLWMHRTGVQRLVVSSILACALSSPIYFGILYASTARILQTAVGARELYSKILQIEYSRASSHTQPDRNLHVERIAEYEDARERIESIVSALER